MAFPSDPKTGTAAPRDVAPGSAGVPPAHHDSPLESMGKAITDAVIEASGEADASDAGERRRVAGERARAEAEREAREEQDDWKKP